MDRTGRSTPIVRPAGLSVEQSLERQLRKTGGGPLVAECCRPEYRLCAVEICCTLPNREGLGKRPGPTFSRIYFRGSKFFGTRRSAIPAKLGADGLRSQPGRGTVVAFGCPKPSICTVLGSQGSVDVSERAQTVRWGLALRQPPLLDLGWRGPMAGSYATTREQRALRFGETSKGRQVGLRGPPSPQN